MDGTQTLDLSARGILGDVLRRALAPYARGPLPRARQKEARRVVYRALRDHDRAAGRTTSRGVLRRCAREAVSELLRARREEGRAC